jgi:hypothetical protein
MDPFSLIAGSVGTLGVLVHSTKVLIELVRDVKGAPAEVLTTAETAQALEKELLNITTEVENGTWIDWERVCIAYIHLQRCSLLMCANQVEYPALL